MADGLRQVAQLPDPVGEVVDGWPRPNGLAIERIRVPLGVVAIIYENRPNVTADAAGLCLKSGNAAVLRGSTTALRSNVAVASVLREAIGKSGLPEDAVILVEDTSYETAVGVMQLDGYVDCLIPRGGPSLLASIREHATVPVVIDGDGNCHVYVDASADLDQAVAIILNAKVQRPSVCNAAETLLVHDAVAPAFLPVACAALAERDVELVGDAAARTHWPAMGEAREADWETEYLALKLAVRRRGVAGRRRRAREPLRHRQHRGDRDERPPGGPPLRGRRRHRHGRGERVDAVQRRRRVRVRGRDRDLDAEAPRPGTDGAARADVGEERRLGRRPDARVRAQARPVDSGQGAHGP